MAKRITPFQNDPLFQTLPRKDQDFLSQAADQYYLTRQDLKNLITIGLDLVSWEKGGVADHWKIPPETLTGKNRKQWSIKSLRSYWQDLKDRAPDYNEAPRTRSQKKAVRINPGLLLDIPEEDRTLMGRCPVASEKTRCCNLHTLDAVINCGFDCSYCTIQSFYNGNAIHFHKNLEEKLKALTLDPDEIYHIGTGQSSDSLMWGNKYGVLDNLFTFAGHHPNVILELKTKSANVDYLTANKPPGNVLATWSLNTQTIIENEERGTASLDERLRAARKAADSGILVGFHFHPMVRYEDWREDYQELFNRVVSSFLSEEIVLISFGTLTYIKPVLKTIRSRGENTKILQMPMEEIAGKYSYPFPLKKEMFTLAYQAFKAWHNDVFFYLCMEDKEIWKPVFGYEYKDNLEFEQTMKQAYRDKITAMD